MDPVDSVEYALGAQLWLYMGSMQSADQNETDQGNCTGGFGPAHLLAANGLGIGLAQSRLQLLSHLEQRLHLQQRPALQELLEVPLVQNPVKQSPFSEALDM